MDFVSIGEAEFFPALAGRWNARIEKLTAESDAASNELRASRAALAAANSQMSQMTAEGAAQKQELDRARQRVEALTKEVATLNEAMNKRAAGAPSSARAPSELFAGGTAYNNLDAVRQMNVGVTTLPAADPLGIAEPDLREVWAVREDTATLAHGIAVDVEASREFIVAGMARFAGRRYITCWIRDRQSNGSTVLIDLRDATATHATFGESIGLPLEMSVQPLFTGWSVFHIHYAMSTEIQDLHLSVMLRQNAFNAHQYAGSPTLGVDLCGLTVSHFH